MLCSFIVYSVSLSLLSFPLPTYDANLCSTCCRHSIHASLIYALRQKTKNETKQNKAALNSLQLRLVATVVSEVLASPLPPMLGMLKPSRSGGAAAAAGAGMDTSTSTSGGRRGPSSDGGGIPEGMGADGGVGPAASAVGGGAQGRGWRGMGMGRGAFPAPTVASSWASQRQADWETLEVGNF